MKLQRTITAPAETVLQAIQDHAGKKFPKVETTLRGNTVTFTRKVLWQKQQATFTIDGDKLTAEGETVDAQKWINHTLGAIDNLLYDHGWSEAAEKHDTKTTRGNLLYRNRVMQELKEGETIRIAVAGVFNKGRVILTVTDQRVILTSDTLAGIKTHTQTIPLDKISSVNSGSGAITGYVEVITSNETLRIEGVIRQEAEAVAKVLG